jgi:hypothetical protein
MKLFSQFKFKCKLPPGVKNGIVNLILHLAKLFQKKLFVLSLDFLFFVKDFQKTDAQVSDLEALSHF